MEETATEHFPVQIWVADLRVSTWRPIPLRPRDLPHRYHMAARRVRLTKAAPPRPSIAVAEASLSVSAIPGQAGWRTDLLHNQMPIIAPRSRTARGAKGLEQLPRLEPAWGFLEAARVPPDAAVNWVDAIFIPPRGDLATLAWYRFDAPDAPGIDQSINLRLT